MFMYINMLICAFLGAYNIGLHFNNKQLSNIYF